jgi:hypothetical protein
VITGDSAVATGDHREGDDRGAALFYWGRTSPGLLPKALEAARMCVKPCAPCAWRPAALPPQKQTAADFLSGSGIKWMRGGTKRQCDRALPAQRPPPAPGPRGGPWSSRRRSPCTPSSPAAPRAGLSARRRPGGVGRSAWPARVQAQFQRGGGCPGFQCGCGTRRMCGRLVGTPTPDRPGQAQLPRTGAKQSLRGCTAV